MITAKVVAAFRFGVVVYICIVGVLKKRNRFVML